MSTHFVWTLRDVIYACFLCAVLITVAYLYLDNLYDKHYRKRKKYHHEP